jgi:hypothetical protein
MTQIRVPPKVSPEVAEDKLSDRVLLKETGYQMERKSKERREDESG